MSTSVLLEAPTRALASNETSNVEALGSDGTSGLMGRAEDVEMTEVPAQDVSEQDQKQEIDQEQEKEASATPEETVSKFVETSTEPMEVSTEGKEEEEQEEVVEASVPVEDHDKESKPVVSLAIRPGDDDARAVALAKRRLEIQIQFMENARSRIQQETHPDFVARQVKIDAERDRLLDEAERHNKLWKHSTAVVYKYECEEAESDYVLHCESLRQEMLDEIQHEVDLINDQRNGVVSAARKTTRKTRSTRGKANTDDRPYGFDAAQRVKKRWGNVYQVLENCLAQSEVDRDLQALEGSYDAMAKKRRLDEPYGPDLPYMAKHYRASLFYRDEVFQEGDEVFIRNFMTGSEYLAILCSITSTELFVLSEKGKYHRLVLMDLRQGRVVVTALSPEQIAALEEHDNGRN